MAVSATIRMYNQDNLGDCFLLKFEDGDKLSYILLDFGSYKGKNEKRELEIAESIRDEVGDNPLTIVLTHQHKDHLTGYVTAEKVFDEMNIARVWFSYLDDPKGPEASNMKKATEKFWKKNLDNKSKARKKFKNVKTVEKMLDAKDGIDIFAEAQTGGQAVTNLLRWGKNNCKFFVPGKNFDLPGLPANAVKVYVLGPPTKPEDLKKLNPGEGEAVHGLNMMLMQLADVETCTNLIGDALDTISGSSVEKDFPFLKKFKSTASTNVGKLYNEKAQDWRRIDYDWLSEMGRLSLHMNSLTNNSSLVLAFELVEAEKVLLFVGDAQIGNWRSWFNVKFKDSDVTADELLMKTVLYKAGHHSSHNATLLEGLNKMNDDLVIMIPVNQKVSDAMHFLMVKPGMMKGYNRKAQGRVIRSDTVFHKPRSNAKFPFKFAAKNSDFKPALKLGKDKSKKKHLFVEYSVN